MHDFDAVVRGAQALADVFRNHYRAVLPSGTAKCNRQVAFALVNVMRDEVDQQIGDAGDEFARLRERAYVFRYALIAAGKGPEFGNKVRIGEKPHIEHQIRVFRNALPEPEADARNQQALLRGLLLEALADQGTQFMNIEFRGINDKVGKRRIEPRWRRSAFSADFTDESAPSG